MMKRFSLPFPAAAPLCVLSALSVCLVPALPAVARADTQTQQPAGKKPAVPVPAARPASTVTPQPWGVKDLDSLMKSLRSATPPLASLTLETKNALLQMLMTRQRAGQAELENAKEGLLVAQARLKNYQTQSQSKAVTPQAEAQARQDEIVMQMPITNAQAFLDTAEKNLKEVGALLLRAQSIPVLPSITVVPVVPVSTPPMSRTLQYTPADAAALIKRNPLLTPEDQAKVGVKRL